jgi:UDP-glucose 6-dehydrogenase
MHIAMIGSGYVGLVSGACLADFGHNVVCVDKDDEKISALKRGESPIFEPGLDDLIKRNTREDRLSFTSDVNSSAAGSNAVFIAVGTPSRRGALVCLTPLGDGNSWPFARLCCQSLSATGSGSTLSRPHHATSSPER